MFFLRQLPRQSSAPTRGLGWLVTVRTLVVDGTHIGTPRKREYGSSEWSVALRTLKGHGRFD